jgi:hypothetical protein
MSEYVDTIRKTVAEARAREKAIRDKLAQSAETVAPIIIIPPNTPPEEHVVEPIVHEPA